MQSCVFVCMNPSGQSWVCSVGVDDRWASHSSHVGQSQETDVYGAFNAILKKTKVKSLEQTDNFLAFFMLMCAQKTETQLIQVSTALYFTFILYIKVFIES